MTLDSQNSTLRIHSPRSNLKSWTMDIFKRNPIIKFCLLLIREMPQSIPLTRNLCVKGPDIIVHGARVFMDELLMEKGTVEE
jgi:hypothetical protein